MYFFLTGCACSWTPGSGLFMTNCSNAGKTTIPKTISSLTSYLLLASNNFGTIKNNSFSYLVNLVWLDLSNSQIYHLESDAFLELQTLGVLVLKENHLCEKNNSYQEGVFNPLAKELKLLDISGNLKYIPPVIWSYPGKALNVLESLEVLRLDCISGQKLSKEFQNLTNLKVLDFSNGLQADYLPNDMFSYISNVAIESINFTNVNLTKINGSIFSTLKSLNVLDLTNNPQLKTITADIALALQKTSIRELYLAKTCLGGNTGSVANVIENLKGTNVSVLTLDFNQIHNMGQSVIFDRLPKLETLTVTHNYIHSYESFLYNLTDAKNLKKLDISYQNTYVPSPCGNEQISSETIKQTKTEMAQHKSESSMFPFPIWWPDKLEWLSLSHNEIRFNPLPAFLFFRNGSIKYVDISNNIFETIPQPFYCYHTISTIEHFDISNCEVQCVTNDFFTKCQWSLRFFNGSHNRLGLLQGGCNENPGPRDFSILLEPLTTLVTLDVSYNLVSSLDEDFLQTQEYLRELIISHNDLTSWRSNMTKWIHLELLDLSYNSLTTLSLETRLKLTQLEGNPKHRTKEHISLNLAGNPLKCTCKNIPFLQWLARTDLILLDMEDYTCTFNGGPVLKMSTGISNILSRLESECSSKVWLIISFGGLIFYLMFITITTTCYRWRHYIKYLILRMRMRRERLQALIGREGQYDFDAFISCTREGAKWLKKHFLPKLENRDTGLKFCIAQRDFMVGKTIIDNIMDSINRSRKTILLVDETFIRSNWCQEELLLSHHVSREINILEQRRI